MSLTARQGSTATRAASAPLPLVVAGGFAGIAAAGLSYAVLGLVALGAWMLDPSGAQEWTQMLEVASAGWLAGFGIAPTVAGVPLTLLPYGFILLPVIGLVGAARWAADASAVARRSEVLAVALSAGLGFAGVAALVAALSRSLAVSPLRAAVTGGLLALVVCLVTVALRSGVLRVRSLPAWCRDVAGAAAAATCALLAASSVLLAISVITHVDAITALLVELDPGLSGGVLIAVLSLGYVPTALVWSLAYLLGPGISIGAGATVSPYVEAASTTLPGFPMLAALPSQAPAAVMALPLLAVAAGALAGTLLRRRGHSSLRGCGRALCAAAVVGLTVGAVAWLATGSLGTTSMVALGPAPALLGGVAAGLVASGAVVVVAWPARVIHD